MECHLSLVNLCWLKLLQATAAIKNPSNYVNFQLLCPNFGEKIRHVTLHIKIVCNSKQNYAMRA